MSNNLPKVAWIGLGIMGSPMSENLVKAGYDVTGYTLEQDKVDRLVAAFLAEQVDSVFDARISGVTKSGLFVQLPQYGADGFIPVSTLGDDYYIFDETARALVGDRTGKGYQLADRVEVKLVEVTPLAGAMRFEMLSDPKPLPGSRRSFHKSKGRGARSRGSQTRPGSRARRR